MPLVTERTACKVSRVYGVSEVRFAHTRGQFDHQGAAVTDGDRGSYFGAPLEVSTGANCGSTCPSTVNDATFMIHILQDDFAL